MKMQNLLLAVSAAFATVTSAQAAVAVDNVASAAAFAGTYTEDLSLRGEANQSADWGSTLTFTQTAGTDGGTYTMSAPDDGSEFTATGTWSISCYTDGTSCALDVSGQDADTFNFNPLKSQITVEGDHGESNGVFNRQ